MLSVPQHGYDGTLMQIKNVTHSRGDTLILKGLNAEILNVTRPNMGPGKAQGQVVGVLGPSGIGKTTLFNLLAGLEPPDEGELLVTMNLVPVQAGMVGVVPQNYYLPPYRTAWNSLMIAAGCGGLTEKVATEKANAMLDHFGMGNKKNSYPAEMSGGQRQRIAIVRQLLCSEKFLLLDEPTSGLDPQNKDAVCKLVTEIASLDELMTILVVSHDINAALQMCDTIWLMGRDRDANGDIVQGAYVKKTYDLIQRGLAWHPDITRLPEFAEMRNEVRAAFDDL